MNFNNIPKIELHCHLDGSVRPQTVLELAKKDKISIPTTDILKLEQMMIAPLNCSSLIEYLKCFSLPGVVMQSQENLKRISFEVFEDAANENIKYMEIRFAPLLHIKNGLSLKEVIKSVIDGMREAEDKYEIKGNLILSCMRIMPVDTCYEVIEAGKSFLQNGVVGIDLCANEDPGFAKYFIEPMKKAKEYGYQISIHAGETGIGENVYDSINLLDAQRIGHGVFIKDCNKSYSLVKEKNITLEICPTSNIQTKAVKSYEDHPAIDFLNDNINITLNTDNRRVSNTTLSNEFKEISNTFNLNSDQLKKIYQNSINASFASPSTKLWLKSFIR